MVEYEKTCLEANTTFVACVLDCYGNWCESGRKMLEEIATARAALGGSPAHVHLRRLILQCNVAMMLGNARTLHKGRTEFNEEALPREAVFDELDHEGSGNEEGRGESGSDNESQGRRSNHREENFGPAPDLYRKNQATLRLMARRGEGTCRDVVMHLACSMDDGLQYNPGKEGRGLFEEWVAGSSARKAVQGAKAAVVSEMQRGVRAPGINEDSEDSDEDSDEDSAESRTALFLEARIEARARWWKAAEGNIPSSGWREFEQGEVEAAVSRTSEEQSGVQFQVWEAARKAGGSTSWRNFREGGANVYEDSEASGDETASDRERREVEEAWVEFCTQQGGRSGPK